MYICKIFVSHKCPHKLTTDSLNYTKYYNTHKKPQPLVRSIYSWHWHTILKNDIPWDFFLHQISGVQATCWTCGQRYTCVAACPACRSSWGCAWPSSTCCHRWSWWGKPLPPPPPRHGENSPAPHHLNMPARQIKV